MNPAKKGALAAEIVVTYLRAKWLVGHRDLPATLAALRPRTTGGPDPGAPGVAAGEQLGIIVSNLLTALPADSRCLIRSLVLTGLLDRRGIPSAFVIGVRPGEAFGAHAWVEVAGRPVLEEGDGAFPRLVAL